MIDLLPTQAALKIVCMNLVAGYRSPLAQCCNTHNFNWAFVLGQHVQHVVVLQSKMIRSRVELGLL